MDVWDDTTINRQYKDRLFCLLFGNAEYMENNLSLYNALCGTNYTDTSAITITTIGNFIYMGMKNDASILICGDMPVWEQQSSYNPNMPLRGMVYYGKLYCGYMKSMGVDFYSRKLIKIPTPQYYVLYNGREKRPAREVMHLSDAFINKDKSGNFEWTANVININPGYNDELLAKCKPLSDYMRFVNNVRENTDRGIELKEAVNMAVHYCQESGIMVDLLSKHEGEVKDMVFTEFDQEQYLKNRREEWLEEGRTEAIYSLVRSGMLSKENAAGHLRISVAELETGMAKEESATKCQ